MVSVTSLITESGLSIYDQVSTDSELWIADDLLEQLLEEHLLGQELGTLPARTRSKRAKEEVCKALGYPIPRSFKKTQPRFVGQDFDVYVQTSNNLQIWNEEITPTRRYVIIRPDAEGGIVRVKVIRGVDLAQFDTTGTLTSKFQARVPSGLPTTLMSEKDAETLTPLICSNADLSNSSVDDFPIHGELLPIGELYERLRLLEGAEFENPRGYSDRVRGEIVHRKICEVLGYRYFNDDGTFPDLKNQLLEVKTQTSPTIDLGLHNPSSELVVLEGDGIEILAQEIRYLVVTATISDDRSSFRVDNLYLSTGKDFPNNFRMFAGKVTNSKIQLPLPDSFFD